MSKFNKHDPQPNLTTVWLIPLDVTDDVIRMCRLLLSEEERARADRFRFDWLSRRYIVAHGRMRCILAHYTGVAATELNFQTTAHGKPFLDPDFKTHFNLSHSSELAVLAVGPWELGADIEFVRPLEDLERMADGFFSPKEVAELNHYPTEERLRAFYRCWTRKEAYVKAIGEGLSIPLHSFVVSLSEQKAALLETSQPAGIAAWTITALDLSTEYVGAVAVAGASPLIETRWWGKCELVISP